MPYQTVSELPESVKKLSDTKRRQWMAVFNSVYNSCAKKGGKAKECEQSSFEQAWGVVNKKEVDMSDEQITTTIPIVEKATMKREADGEHPASHYLVVEDPQSPSTWHLRVKDPSGKVDNRLMGAAWAALHQGYRGNKYTGPNKQAAISKLKKLYEGEGMDTPKAKESDEKDILISGTNTEAEIVVAVTPPISFEELEAQDKVRDATWSIQLLTDRFEMLVNNVMLSGDVEYKAMSIRRLAEEYAARVDQIAAKAAMKEKKLGLVERAIEGVKGALGLKPEPEPEQNGNIMFYKDGDTVRWIGAYSNKFKDNDNPPDILSSASHQDFVKAVNDGEWPYPTFRLWHIPVDLGKAEWVGYDDSGFALAAGVLFKEYHPLLPYLAKGQWIMSHGMPFIERDTKEKHIITKYRSSEISALPIFAAANKLTAFFIKENTQGGEKDMSLSEQDKKKLAQMFGDDGETVVNLVESGLQARAAQAVEAGVESKEVKKDAEKEEVKEQKEEVLTEKPTQPPAPEYATKTEVLEAMQQLTAHVVTLTEQVGALAGQMDKVKEAQEEPLARTPSASIAELLAQSITKGKVGADKMHGRTPKELSGPTESAEPVRKATGVPFLDQMLAKPN